MKLNEVDNDIRNYLTIKEYSEKCGNSYQSIYKKLKNTDNVLNNYVRFFNSQRMIHKQALIEINGIVEQQANEVENDVELSFTIENEVEQKRINEKEKIFNIDYKDELIKILKEELEQKNNQIEKLQTLLDQEQRLAVSDREKIKLLEARAEEQEKEQKKSFWRKLFGNG